MIRAVRPRQPHLRRRHKVEHRLWVRGGGCLAARLRVLELLLHLRLERLEGSLGDASSAHLGAQLGQRILAGELVDLFVAAVQRVPIGVGVGVNTDTLTLDQRRPCARADVLKALVHTVKAGLSVRAIHVLNVQILNAAAVLADPLMVRGRAAERDRDPIVVVLDHKEHGQLLVGGAIDRLKDVTL